MNSERRGAGLPLDVGNDAEAEVESKGQAKR